MPNPTHPATAHIPLTLTLLTTTLDLLSYTLSTRFSPLASTLLSLLSLSDLTPHLSLLSYHTTRLFLLFSLPAILTGILEFHPLIDKEGGVKSRKAKTVAKHALLSYANVIGMGWNWWVRGGREGREVKGAEVVVSLVVGGVGALAMAHLGGRLVYEFGMGVGRGRSWKRRELMSKAGGVRENGAKENGATGNGVKENWGKENGIKENGLAEKME
ncbi:hypothetical protein M011DRAFT_164841 [Sporormia fimetaria CBS 119925]|uniref:DUF2231 domain-containing protein n=1 Tax=Sporormia fimetaria CBS 119925 TaxID=1340428 RepID=A0A6A6V3U2_9PLEO|nr:hypothetical protein M011DRAFT_164841 [Sporormia fimetaria CBS 119925]